MPKASEKPSDYIVPLNINGLQGRMLRAPSTTKRQREILYIYGHHAMIERWWGLIENLRAYGNVTVPDLPGFGGMESFYKINTRPTIDAFADYLAAFIKLRYRRKRLTIVALSYGFVVVTRMLQRYPELAGKVDLMVGMVGFMHRDDLVFSPKARNFYRLGARFFATRPVALIIRYGALNRFVINFLTKTLPRSKHRFIEVTQVDFERSIDFEVQLWQANDVRTHWLTTSEFLNLDNCAKKINLPAVHIVSAGDHYLNNVSVEQHMRKVFSDYRQFTANSKAHVPSVIADRKEMAVLVPAGLRRILSRAPAKVK